MALPIVPALKLLALGSVKIVLLAVGAAFVPVFTVRLVIGGTGESVRLVANSLLEHDKLEQTECNELLRLLQKVQDAELNRPQARGLLIEMMRKTVASMGSSIKNMFAFLASFFKRN